MRTTGLACVALGAVLLAGCSKADNDTHQSGSQQVSVKGCVEAAPGTNQYVLRNISTTAADTGLTDGSWAKLRVGDADDQLRGHVGRMVSITGTITDSGRDTIGTGGQAAGPDDPGSRTDASRAGKPEHYSEKVAKEAGPIGQQSLATGTAPEISVQTVTATASGCPSR